MRDTPQLKRDILRGFQCFTFALNWVQITSMLKYKHHKHKGFTHLTVVYATWCRINPYIRERRTSEKFLKYHTSIPVINSHNTIFRCRVCQFDNTLYSLSLKQACI